MTDLGKNLDDASAALQKNDLAAAKAAYKLFDSGWIDAEGYVQQFNRKLYQAIEDAMTPIGRELLRNANTTVDAATPLLKTLSDTYKDVVKQMSAVAQPGTGTGAPAIAAISGPDVDAATAKVDEYLKGESDKLVTNTQTFVAAVKSKDLAKAKATYQQARYNYESIEFLAEVFTDLDVAIDARPDDFPQGENDPTWTGFHPLEKAIWADGKLDANTDKLADKLLADVNTLHGQVKTLTIDPGVAIAGAADLIEEIQSGKITGEEERYGHTDFNDFKANLASAKFVYQAYSPFVKQRNAALDTTITAAFADVEKSLVPYFSADGVAVDYSKLNDADRKALAQKVEALADSFSKVNGTLGLNA
jgi:iron uptake system component EfeO